MGMNKIVAFVAVTDYEKARAFYEKSGFAPDGARTTLDGELAHIPEIRMVRRAETIQASADGS